MAKNLDYEILKAVQDFPEEFLENLEGGVFSLAKLKIQLNKRGVDTSGIDRKTEQLIKAGLLIRANHNGYIAYITSEGRLFLDRLDSKRFEYRFRDWFIGGVATIFFGLIVIYAGHMFGWNK